MMRVLHGCVFVAGAVLLVWLLVTNDPETTVDVGTAEVLSTSRGTAGPQSSDLTARTSLDVAEAEAAGQPPRAPGEVESSAAASTDDTSDSSDSETSGGLQVRLFTADGLAVPRFSVCVVTITHPLVPGSWVSSVESSGSGSYMA